MTLVKLCGLCSVEDVLAANEAGPDMVGMILAPGFRRTVDIECARSMTESVREGIMKVGVFVDQPTSEVCQIATGLGLDAVQLHGNENDAYIDGLRALLGISIIKSFDIGASGVDRIEQSHADLVLIDPGQGSGRTFDLSLLEGLGRRFILAGGLTPDNVADAVRRVRPYAVDTSSGVETDHRKDKMKMIGFVQSVREAESMQEETE